MAGISSAYREQISILIKNLKVEGKTVLMIEHNIDFTAETADCFLLMIDGLIYEYCSFNQLKLSQTVADAYFF